MRVAFPAAIHVHRPAVFLDLQGTLGDVGEGDIRNFVFYPFAASAIRLLKQADSLTVVFTNQSGIGRGRVTAADFERQIARLRSELATFGTTIDAVYLCPHTDQDGCLCRKPKPGMLLEAQADFDLELTDCAIVGDVGAWEMVMAREVGSIGVLVRAGDGEASLGRYRDTWSSVEPDFVASNVLDAAEWLATTFRRAATRTV